MKNTRIIPMRRLPGPASCPLGDGVKAPEAPVELFRGWQRTQTQSSVRTLRGLRQQMDVWFCLMQESSAERLCCVTVDPDQTNCAPSGARPGILCFSLDLDLHRGARPGILCFSLDLDLHRCGLIVNLLFRKPQEPHLTPRICRESAPPQTPRADLGGSALFVRA